MSIVHNRKAGGCSLLIMGFIFAIVGGCILLFLSADTIITCQRSTDTCIVEKSSLLGRKEVTAQFPLSRLKSAEVESKEGSRKTNGSRRKPTYQVVLRTDDGTIRLSQVWTDNRKDHRKSATEINAYLASSEDRLSIVQSGKTVRLVGGLFFAIGGFAFVRGLWTVLRIFRNLAPSLLARG